MKVAALLMLIFAAAVSARAEEVAADSVEAKILTAESRLAQISDPAARLFFRAGIERAKGEPEQALRTLSELLVLHADEERWAARSELICAQLYLELGLPEAADVTARQIQFMYEGTEQAAKAGELRAVIRDLKERTEDG